MTYVHYIEQIYGVPHMYHKYFTRPCWTTANLLMSTSSTTFAISNLASRQKCLNSKKDLIDKNLISFEQAGNTKVYSASCSLLMKEGLKNLAKNPFYFLETPPEFEEGNIPLV